MGALMTDDLARIVMARADAARTLSYDQGKSRDRREHPERARAGALGLSVYRRTGRLLRSPSLSTPLGVLELMLRQCTAIVLMLCFTFFSGEAVVAEVHDGDATAAELQRDGETHGGVRAATFGDDARSAVIAASDGAPIGDRVPVKPLHTEHNCHCVHAHGAEDAASARGGMGDVPHPGAPAAHAVRIPPSLDHEPRLRPPIAG